jgi:hypothetical protein
MKPTCSPKVHHIFRLRRRAAQLRAHYHGGMARFEPSRHRAQRCDAQARLVASTLTRCELAAP